MARLLSQFIYGYILVDSKGRLGDIVRNPNYGREQDTTGLNLIYDYSAIRAIDAQGEKIIDKFCKQIKISL